MVLVLPGEGPSMRYLNLKSHAFHTSAVNPWSEWAAELQICVKGGRVAVATNDHSTSFDKLINQNCPSKLYPSLPLGGKKNTTSQRNPNKRLILRLVLYLSVSILPWKTTKNVPFPVASLPWQFCLFSSVFFLYQISTWAHLKMVPLLMRNDDKPLDLMVPYPQTKPLREMQWNASAIFPRCERHYNCTSQLPLMRHLFLLVGRANRAQSFAPLGEHRWSTNRRPIYRTEVEDYGSIWSSPFLP